MGPSRIAGRYELQEQLGEGGMGVVFRALDTKTGSYVAIKLMKDISDPVAVDLFTKEWRALAEISHPNIVEVRDVDSIDENRQKKPFFVMPLLRGATLADLITGASVRLTPARIVEIVTHVCRGLQAAHQRGLVHRDLKPSNIFVMDDDTAKIIDFGVVHLVGSKSVTGQKGTLQYMSPEQAQLGEITPASDLFSLGVILYEALTLRKPFARNTADDTMEAVIKYMPPSVSEINPSINLPVSMVVHKCLAKPPIHRFGSARELAEALQKAFRNETVFDTAKIEPRIERAKSAFKSGDEVFASEILAELEAEGHLDARIKVLRMQIDLVAKQKKIRQLLEGARARMEQDEIPLALDKLREVLEVDPQNPDALAMREAIRKRRSEDQINKWFDLAQTHLSNRDFSAARHAAQEVLAIRAGDTKALDLLEKIESIEAEARRIREQKEQLYSSALRAYQNGEIETALSKLERLFSVARANPSAAVPERDAVYQSFYKEVRSESDVIHSALEDAQRQFSEKNFTGAMTVCRELLAKYPNDGIFQALKIRIEDAERQELSSYIAEMSKRVEGEPDLDRRVNILREASERYPNEAQFAQQLKLVRERRDLVNSIVAKARQYEERCQYAESISQWDILRNIHPQYPGIAIELEQCKKKRDRQAREEEQVRLVEEVDRLMESRAYAKAIECADAALRDFPGDAELSGLRTLAEQGLERTKESRRLFEEGQRALAENDPVRATDLLRNGLALDPRGPGLRECLVGVLTERARMLAEENWQEAEPLYQEASGLDSNHPAVRALRSTISEAKRQTFVGQCLNECRALVAAGEMQTAAARIRTARTEYPNDHRLEQYEASLQKEANAARRREGRVRDMGLLNEDRSVLEQNPDRQTLRAVLERSHIVRQNHPDDHEIGETVAEIELAVKRVAQVDDLSQLLRVEPVLTGTDGRVVVSKADKRQQKIGPHLVDRNAEKTKIYDKEVTEQERKPDQFRILLEKAETLFHDTRLRAVAWLRPAGKWSGSRLGILGGVIAVAAAVGYLIGPTPGASKPKVLPSASLIHIVSDPADSTISSEGKALSDGVAKAGATVEVSRLGYKTKQVQVQQESDGKVVLEPEPLRVSLLLSTKGGTVELDGHAVSELSDGSVGEYSLTPDGNSHKLQIVLPGKQSCTVEFQSVTGSLPQITAVDARDFIIVSTLGDKAKVFSGSGVKNIQFGEQSVAMTPSGSDLNLSEENKELKFGEGNDQGSLALERSNAPVLIVRSLASNGQYVVRSAVENAKLTVDGRSVPRQKQGWLISGLTGTHTFTVFADGYETQSWTVTLQRGQTATRLVDLLRKAIVPVLAALNISGGTPGTQADLDGKKIGELDASGNLRVLNILAAGKHSLVLSKPGYDARTFELNTSSSELRVPGAALIPWATLSFQGAPRNVTIKIRRNGDTQFRDAGSLTKMQLPSGQYEIVAETPSFEKFNTVVNIGREDISIPLKLIAIPDYEIQDITQITHDGPWLRAKTPNKFVYTKPGLLREIIIFARPGKTLFKYKKVEWLIETADLDARVLYALEGQKFTRKLVIGEETSNTIETKVDAQAAGQQTSMSVHVRVDGSRIRITNDKGAVLDDLPVPGQDFTNGRIGIKTDSLFLVRSDIP
jgi:serine/threonine-protein kinase